MKIFIYYSKIIPRIPIPIVKDPEGMYHNGEFLIISREIRVFQDFLTLNKSRIHISNPMQIEIKEEEFDIFSQVFQTLCNSIVYRFNLHDFQTANILILPQFVGPNPNIFENTLDWCKTFINQILLSDSYTNLAIKMNKSSKGKDLMNYMHENGAAIDRFFAFIQKLDVPVSEFIENTQANEKYTEDAHLNVAIFFGTKFMYNLIENFAVTSHKGTEYRVIKRAIFNKSIDSIIPSRKISYKEFFAKKSKVTDLDPILPFIHVIPPRTEFETAEDLMNSLTNYPEHYNLFQMNLDYIRNMKLSCINDILARIPEDFVDDIDEKENFLPIELCFYYFIPRTVQSAMQYYNRLIEQIKPIKSGDIAFSNKVKNAIRHFRNTIDYKFKNWNIVSQLLLDPTFNFRSSQFVHCYQRLEYLGDAVLDLLFGFAIYNSCPDANEGIMSELKVALCKNNLFTIISERLGIKDLIETNSISNYEFGKKGSADLFEALFGAIYLDSDLFSAVTVFKIVIEEDRDQIIQAISHPLTKTALDYIIATDVNDILTLDLPKRLSVKPLNAFDISKAIRMDISNNQVTPFTVALTHSSAGLYNYERLEFVGDIIVKFAIISSQFAAFPNAAESGMSIASAYLKSNDILGRSAFKMELHKLLYTKQELNINSITINDIDNPYFPITKVLGDIFESTTAAISGTFGLARAVNFVIQNIINPEWMIDADDPTLPAKVKLIHVMQTTFHLIPTFTIYSNDGKFYCVADIGDVRLPAIGESTEKNMSQTIFSKTMLEMIETTDIMEKIKADLESTHQINPESNYVVF